MNLLSKLKRLECYASKLVEKKTKKAQADRYKLWSLEMVLESMMLQTYFPDTPKEVIDRDVESRPFRCPTDESLIRHGINLGWKFVDWMDQLDSLL